ncbi:uncharacterized protein LY79DRAFT_583617 [Colletotrichum navitas]|uniref:Uncharacterized protein n=1 Tax=Colletotrichum navitas TaxID=681940 RepID=A0AAD8UZB9_9PEZI|nr:uncharacterized protein LY79DRAFT_583617 [Colletotrichum navitas]KAK1573492.1 hypothetical protein LY79DRAFT_583617 [Colletotrichum navitas]
MTNSRHIELHRSNRNFSPRIVALPQCHFDGSLLRAFVPGSRAQRWGTAGACWTLDTGHKTEDRTLGHNTPPGLVDAGAGKPQLSAWLLVPIHLTGAVVAGQCLYILPKYWFRFAY